MRGALIAVLAGTLAACATSLNTDTSERVARTNAAAKSTLFVNGQWYREREGTMRFEPGQRYAVNGVFTDQEPEDYAIIDLQGRFVVPPFGEAHNHSVDAKGTEKVARKYLSQGIFYYKNVNGFYSLTAPMLEHWARPDTLDVSFSFGGLSRDEGHPEKLYRMLSGFGLYPQIDAESLDGNAFYDVNSPEQLEAKWDLIVSRKPDVLKLYLLEHDTDQSDGLSKSMFREIIKRAKTAGIPTTVHVETVQDLALAVRAGADEAAHLPAYNLKFSDDEARSKIPDALVEEMADAGFVVVTTTNVSRGRDYSDEEYARVAHRQADNLRRLHAAGVPVAIGSDTFFQTARDEIKTLRAMQVFDDATLLRLWLKTAAVSIFPKRAIGTLQPGYEASFLALDCDPINNLDCVDRIGLAYKQGVRLRFEPSEPDGPASQSTD